MTFLSPFMLAALGAVAAPIIIHLLNKTQTRRVPWAAMRFLLECVEKNQRRMRIEELLLLFLRCLLLALIALAFARPVWNAIHPPAEGKKGPVAAVILLDASLSMRFERSGETNFDRAKKEASRLVAELPPGSQTALFLVSDQVQKVLPEPVNDVTAVQRALDGLSCGYGAGNLVEGIRAAIDTLASRADLPGEIYLVTDNQQFAWRDLGSVSSLVEKAGGRIRVQVKSVTADEAGNAAVSDIRLAEGTPGSGQPFPCRVEVSNWNSSALANVPVKLLADGLAVADAVIPRISPGQSASVELTARFEGSGFHVLTASLSHDALPADDERSLAVSASDQMRILIVEENTGRQIAERDGFFLSQALMPVKTNQSFHLKAVALPVADLSRERLEGVDVVILANVAQIPQAGVEALRDFVTAGGGLVVFPGPSANLDFYNNDPVFASLLPAKLGRKVEVREGARAPLLQSRGFSHPVLTLWDDPKIGGLEGVYLLGYYPLKPEPGATVAATMTGDQPAIVEGKAGKGRSVLFNTNATTRWTNLPLNPSFVPLMHRLVDYAGSHISRELSLSPGTPFVFNVASSLAGREFFVAGPDGKKQSGGSIGTGGILRYTGTQVPGAYTVFPGMESTEPLAIFAVQTYAPESRLWPASPAELAVLGDFEKEPVKNFSDGSVAVGSGKNFEFWLVLMVAALVVASGEMALAWRISRNY